MKTSESKLKRILIIVFGHLLVCSGAIEAIRGGHYYGGFLVPRFFDFLLALLGVGFILYGGLARLTTRNAGDEVVICAACETPFYEKDADSGKCPECGGPITTLKGYYCRRNRRPEN